MLTSEQESILDALDQEFMQPSTAYLSTSEAREYLDDEEATAGWYYRLSAPGYLDCTDWTGPFESEESATIALIDEFGD